MRVAVVHDTLNPCGGAERLALYMVKALRELGYENDLILIEKTSWRRVKAIFGEDFRNYIASEVIVLPFRKVASIYGRYAEWFLRDIVSFTSKLRTRYDAIIVTKQLHVPVFADAIYVHFPDFYPSVENLYYPERYVYNALLRVYSLPSHIISKLLIEIFKRIRYKPLILTNSKFSKALIRRWLRVDACVLYPPVSLEKFKTFPSSGDGKRGNIIVTIGRIERGKNLHLIPLIASKLPINFNFFIIGSSAQEKYRLYLNDLIRKLNVASKVRVIVNADENMLTKILSLARYYLHTAMYEHFGVAVVEAMAAGLIPIVHKKSGAWIDLLEQGKYGYGYQDPEDIIKILTSLPKENIVESELRFKVRTRASYFSYDLFKVRVGHIMKKILEVKDR